MSSKGLKICPPLIWGKASTFNIVAIIIKYNIRVPLICLHAAINKDMWQQATIIQFVDLSRNHNLCHNTKLLRHQHHAIQPERETNLRHCRKSVTVLLTTIKTVKYAV